MVVEPPSNPARIAAGGLAVADQPLTLEFLEEERRVPFIEILYRATGDVVTVIEILSPSNKSGEGRDEYLRKQRDLLNSQVNLVEVDLLGYGQPTTLVRAAKITDPPKWRYAITISRVQRRRGLEAYVFNIEDKLPRCVIPLRAADPDVVLDLPTVFSRCYDIGGYDLLIDYAEKPPVSLDEDETQWLEAYLQDKNLRQQ